MKKSLIFALCLLAAWACEKNPVNPGSIQPGQGSAGAYDVRITPVMTKVTATQFEEGDAIGVTITRATGVYADNAKLTYSGSTFSGSLKWYSDGEDGATISAYYPYSQTVPTSFTVEADQSEGVEASDFVAGVKAEVTPTSQAVVIPFTHKLVRIVLNVTNNSSAAVSKVEVNGVRLTANLAADFTATVDENAEPAGITAHSSGEGSYAIILPPQTAALEVVITTGAGEYSQTLQEATLDAGKQYSINAVVSQTSLSVVLSGEIAGWEDGGELGADNDIDENLTDGYIVYGEEQYGVALMDDGKWWMTENLRYVPEGLEVSEDLYDVAAGVFYPVVVNGEQNGAMFSTDEEDIAARGYLYQAEVALGLSVGALTTVEAAQELEGVRGICPVGWHVPTIDDITGLVGKAVSPIATNADAPYYDGSNGSIALLNADGFNMDAFGAVTIQDNTKTVGTLMGFMTAYPDRIVSGMFCGSSYAGVTYNTSNDETSGIKNLQFYGLMPMTNKADAAQYTCNGTKVSYRIAAPLRCVRDSE